MSLSCFKDLLWVFFFLEKSSCVWCHILGTPIAKQSSVYSGASEGRGLSEGGWVISGKAVGDGAASKQSSAHCLIYMYNILALKGGGEVETPVQDSWDISSTSICSRWVFASLGQYETSASPSTDKGGDRGRNLDESYLCVSGKPRVFPSM